MQWFDWLDKISNVPSESTDGACRFCLGICGLRYDNCYKCGNVWISQEPAIQRACDLIAACTVAVQPSDWYNVMSQYKRGSPQQLYNNSTLVATILHVWLNEHWGKLADALSGFPTAAVVVPSRTAPIPTPLHGIVKGQPLLEGICYPCAIRYCGQAGSHWKHQRLEPGAFLVDHQVISGQRVILVEDTWVTGSTALSAALAVRRAGARSLVLISIARMVYEDDMTDAYRDSAAPPWDPKRFPRT